MQIVFRFGFVVVMLKDKGPTPVTSLCGIWWLCVTPLNAEVAGLNLACPCGDGQRKEQVEKARLKSVGDRSLTPPTHTLTSPLPRNTRTP